jgi:hypothetical protein
MVLLQQAGVCCQSLSVFAVAEPHLLQQAVVVLLLV